MPQEGFEPTIPVGEKYKLTHALVTVNKECKTISVEIKQIDTTVINSNNL
jgi:hypothetical protein